MRALKTLITIILTVSIIITFAACGAKQATTEPTESLLPEGEGAAAAADEGEKPVTLSVKSDSIIDSKLKTVCAATRAGGKNAVPQLSWNAIPDAKAYVILMLDEDAGNWLHMQYVTDKTEIKEGEQIDGKYVGPYPPNGTGMHIYKIYVIAVENAPAELPGSFDTTNKGIDELTAGLGTILAQDYVAATYTYGDKTE